jgi:lipopolysaccharide biosynthesis protein
MKARIIANYLPQFHPIPENDKFWGPGFTEWTNVARAKPLFHGHYQPRIPADLGFYDLRLPEIREQQAQLAKDAGVEGFCYWHYWLGNGKELLQRPFKEVQTSGKPDFPFCLCWANHDWSTRSWKRGAKDMVIAQQLYPGEDDYTNHFNSVLPAFKDHRYITVDGKPMFVIYDPYHFPDVTHFITTWRKLAEKNGCLVSTLLRCATLLQQSREMKPAHLDV